MVRGKTGTTKIEDKRKRQVSYTKRRHGLMKKVYELSILSDIDITFLSFSPSGQLSIITKQNKLAEDLWDRYVNDPKLTVENRARLVEIMNKLKRIRESAFPSSPVIQGLQQEIYNQEIFLCQAKERLRAYEQVPESGEPIDMMLTREAIFMELHQHIMNRKHQMTIMFSGRTNIGSYMRNLEYLGYPCPPCPQAN